MELTPSQLTNATFRTVRKGYDPDEVDAFLEQAAGALELAQQQATAMEARARAAVARLQEAAAAAEQAKADPTPATRTEEVAPGDAETITRTLLLAQRTADTAVAEAKAEAERLVSQAQAEAESTIDSTREMSSRLLEDAKAEARSVGEAEREAAQNEVQSLVARREFLVGDVDQLEQFLAEQRERLRAAARQIEALCERVPAGLGEAHRPVLSASADDAPTHAVTDTVSEAVSGRPAALDPELDADGLPPTEQVAMVEGVPDDADDGHQDDDDQDDAEPDTADLDDLADVDGLPRQTVLIDDLRPPD